MILKVDTKVLKEYNKSRIKDILNRDIFKTTMIILKGVMF